jgi:hypothetical protein
MQLLEKQLLEKHSRKAIHKPAGKRSDAYALSPHPRRNTPVPQSSVARSQLMLENPDSITSSEEPRIFARRLEG